jgi:hypothetical protein
MMGAELDGVICSGARRGKQFTYALLDERAPQARRLARDEALAEFAARYFTSRGPATVKDFARWSGLTLSDAKKGLGEAGQQLDSETLDGETYWFPPSASPKREKSPSALILSVYDEYVMGYADRTALAQAGRTRDFQVEVSQLISYIIVIDGQLMGTLKRTLTKDTVVVTIKPATNLTAAEKLALKRAAQRFSEFLGLDLELIE